MDKKPSETKRIVRLTVVLIFFAMLLFPMTMMLFDGPDHAAMESEAEVTLKAPTINSFLDGSFQSSFESWIAGHYPLRSSIVSTYRQMRYNFENTDAVISMMALLTGTYDELKAEREQANTPVLPVEPSDPTPSEPTTPTQPIDPTTDPVEPDDPPTPADPTPSEPTTPTQPAVDPNSPWAVYLDPNNMYAAINAKQLADTPTEPRGYKGNNSVYIGKSGYLYEASYMQEYLGQVAPYNTVTDEGMQLMVDRLEYIQTELKKRGIEMLYVITSSKASAYSDYIPEYFKNMGKTPEGYVRPIERLRPMLANSSINYLDSAKYYEQIGLLVTFPKTGIHWNALAAFESTSELIRMYQRLSGEQTVTLSTKGVRTSTEPFNEGNPEKDVFQILYGAIVSSSAIVDEAYYAPDIVVTNADAPKINVLLQGGSFAHSIVYYLRQYGVADVTQIYYNGTSATNNMAEANVWTQGPEAWAYWLEGKDLVIFEATEQQIRGGHKTDDMTWTQASGNGNLGHNAIYDSLYEYLKSHEGEY